MFLSVNKYSALLSLCGHRVLPVIVKPETAARPSAALFAALIYGLGATTEPLRATAAFCALLRNLQAAAWPCWRGGEGEKSFPAPQGGLSCTCGSAGLGKGLGTPGQGWGWCRMTQAVHCHLCWYHTWTDAMKCHCAVAPQASALHC